MHLPLPYFDFPNYTSTRRTGTRHSVIFFDLLSDDFRCIQQNFHLMCTTVILMLGMIHILHTYSVISLIFLLIRAHASLGGGGGGLLLPPVYLNPSQGWHVHRLCVDRFCHCVLDSRCWKFVGNLLKGTHLAVGLLSPTGENISST